MPTRPFKRHPSERPPWPLGLSLLTALLILTAAASASPTRRPPARHAPAPPRVPSAEELYVRSLQADDLFTFKGRQVTTYWVSGRTADALVYHRPPDFRRIYSLNPESQRGRLLVSDGRQEWQYDPRKHEVRHRMLSPGALDDDDVLSYSLLRANYLLQILPQPHMVADRRAYLLTITRPRGHTLARRLWIDAGSGLVLKRELYREDGRLVVTEAFSEITFHPRPSPELSDLSRLTHAPGIRFVDEHSASAPETPLALSAARAQFAGHAYAPPALGGYRLVGASTLTVGAKPLLHLRYSDGLNLISLFEQRRTQAARPTRVQPGMRDAKIGQVPVHVSRRATLSTLNWDTPTLNLTLMGEMGTGALRGLAAEAVRGH